MIPETTGGIITAVKMTAKLLVLCPALHSVLYKQGFLNTS